MESLTVARQVELEKRGGLHDDGDRSWTDLDRVQVAVEQIGNFAVDKPFTPVALMPPRPVGWNWERRVTYFCQEGA